MMNITIPGVTQWRIVRKLALLLGRKRYQPVIVVASTGEVFWGDSHAYQDSEVARMHAFMELALYPPKWRGHLKADVALVPFADASLAGYHS